MYVNLKIKIQGEMLTHDEPIIKNIIVKYNGLWICSVVNVVGNKR